jgi:F-type H+-transporting ATPase subunit epsilon
MKVAVVSPERILFDGEAAALTVPAYDGLIGILPRHAPLLALLGRGVLMVRLKEGGERRFRVGGGFVQVRANNVRLVTEEAVAIDFGGPSSQ